MKLSIKEGSENYTCAVVKIGKIFDIDGADRIKRTVVFGVDVIVGLDVKEGDIMLYFCSGTKLNPEYCKYNNLYSNYEMNADITAKGYLSKQGRVKTLKLRGVLSDGMLMPLSSLYFEEGSNFNTIVGSLDVGDEFTTIDGIDICEKYVVPPKSKGTSKQKKSSKVSRLVDKMFYFHNDTANYRRNLDKIKPDDIIGIHYKKHGTSVIVSNLPVKKDFGWFGKVLKWFGIERTEYDYIYSSRKVIKNGYLNTNPNAYYKTDIWGEVKNELQEKDVIPKNWTLYGEILGYESDGSPIQKGYDYGCKPGEHKFYVYRITVVNPDGITLELTDRQIASFCRQHGLNYEDTFIYYGKAKDLYPDLYYALDQNGLVNGVTWEQLFMEQLEKDYNEKLCYMCVNKVPEEGIVIRKEHLYEYEAYKLKSMRFLEHESAEQEEGVTNIEDNQEIEVTEVLEN